MKMLLKRYRYKNGLDIIAPLKCGTRWLEGLNPSGKIYQTDFRISDLSKNVHSGTTFIYRPIWEHLKSAIETELSLGLDVKSLITHLKSESLDHWNPNLYKELYPLWKEYGFRFYKLKDLSNISISSGTSGPYEHSMYKFKLPPQWKSVDSVLEEFPYNDIVKLKRAVMNEEMWLKMMVGTEYNSII